MKKKEIIYEDRDRHVKNDDDAYNAKRVDKEKSKIDQSITCQTFDLQECLPTSFREACCFLKKLYCTYNLSTHNLATGQTSCYLWHKSMARRGANKITPCTYKKTFKLTK